MNSLQDFYEKNLQALLLHKEFRPDQLCFAIEQICMELEQKSKYVKAFELSFPIDSPLKLSLELTDERPLDYSYENISFFFLRIVTMAQKIGNLLITQIRFEEGAQDVLLRITEPINEKTCAFDFKQTGIKNGLENYFGESSGFSA